ncbi:MAG: hypothetical protein LC114_19120, partial [Bryobacterales bacterium]|nr:hypothetical protein [Bryobacterales bacterium]
VAPTGEPRAQKAPAQYAAAHNSQWPKPRFVRVFIAELAAAALDLRVLRGFAGLPSPSAAPHCDTHR